LVTNLNIYELLHTVKLNAFLSVNKTSVHNYELNGLLVSVLLAEIAEVFSVTR